MGQPGPHPLQIAGLYCVFTICVVYLCALTDPRSASPASRTAFLGQTGALARHEVPCGEAVWLLGKFTEHLLLGPAPAQRCAIFKVDTRAHARAILSLCLKVLPSSWQRVLCDAGSPVLKPPWQPLTAARWPRRSWESCAPCTLLASGTVSSMSTSTLSWVPSEMSWPAASRKRYDIIIFSNNVRLTMRATQCSW